MNPQHLHEENLHARVWIMSMLDMYKELVRSYERMKHRECWEEASFIDAKNKVRALKHTMNMIQREIITYETTVLNQN